MEKTKTAKEVVEMLKDSIGCGDETGLYFADKILRVSSYTPDVENMVDMLDYAIRDSKNRAEWLK